MKRMVRLFGVMMAAAIVCTACSKKVNVDSSKWIDNFADGKAVAQQENKRIILFFSADDQDQESTALKTKIFNTDEFLKSLTKKYVLVNLDFSNSLFEKAQSKDTATKEEKAAAEKVEKKLKENMKQATFYNVQSSPAFYVLTKEGYVITPLSVESTLENTEAFNQLLAAKEADMTKYDAMLKATNEGNAQAKVKAINALYEATDPQMRYVLSGLSQKLVDLDKKNKSGFVGKHILACANAAAMDAYLSNDSAKASAAFAEAGENKMLSADESQQAYYTAGYLLGQSGSTDYKAMKKYFQSAYDAKPDSEHAAQIKQMISVVDSMETQSAAEKQSAAPVAGPQKKPAQTPADTPVEKE
jgi:thioredoxin-related protein